MVVGAVFAAVAPTPDARAEMVEGTKGLDIPGRLTPIENWHITLRYLGAVDQVTYERFLGGLGEVGECGPFQLGLGGIGAFPNPRRATVVWVGVDRGADALYDLAVICEEAAEGAGIAREDRPFRPHLTLARVRPPADVTSIVDTPVPARWLVDRVIVFQTVSGRGGVRYEPLETVPLRV